MVFRTDALVARALPRHSDVTIPERERRRIFVAAFIGALPVKLIEARIGARGNFIEELGSGRIAHAAFGSGIFAAVIPLDIRVAPGDLIGLGLPLARLHAWKTGRHLDMTRHLARPRKPFEPHNFCDSRRNPGIGAG